MNPREPRERAAGGWVNGISVHVVSSYADEKISLPQTLSSPGSEIIADHHDDITAQTGVELKLLKNGFPFIAAVDGRVGFFLLRA